MSQGNTGGPVDATPAALQAALDGTCTDPALQWLAQARTRVAGAPADIHRVFPAAGRHVGHHVIIPAGGAVDEHTRLSSPAVRTAADAARVLLLIDLGPAAASVVDELYRFGAADERRAVLHALPWLAIGDEAASLVADAIRTNDARLLGAALSPYGMAHLSSRALAQAILKCVFSGVPLAEIAGLDQAASPELSRMLAGYVHERIAAGRTVPAGVWPLVDAFPPADELAAIEAETRHPVEDRRRAAAAALAQRGARHGERTEHAHF